MTKKPTERQIFKKASFLCRLVMQEAKGKQHSEKAVARAHKAIEFLNKAKPIKNGEKKMQNNTIEKATSFAEPMALLETQKQNNSTKTLSKIANVKRNPGYYRDLINYPKVNPVLIATHWNILNYFHRLKAVCLLCLVNSNYNFSMLDGREVWLIYIKDVEIELIYALGRQIQSYASKVMLILFDSNLWRISCYE